MLKVTVIGGGLAGCEAAWQLARRGCQVTLYEMRPQTMTPAHSTGHLAELVCSNSLGASNLDSAGGLLKAELRQLNSLIMECADAARVPAGGALAVDREVFSRVVTKRIEENPNIQVRRQLCSEFPLPPAIIATGPLTDTAFARVLTDNLGEGMLSFYDAASPIIDASSIDFSKAFWGSRYGKGGEDYLNCPMDSEEYKRFWTELIEAKTVLKKDFEKGFFESCLPVEVLAQRGAKTLLFGPLKPVGLLDPRSGKQPFAVVQLRREDVNGTMFNMVGFQTNLVWGEQKRVFRLIPGLEKAEFYRFGVMHRNSFINSPKLLVKNYQLKDFPGVYVAGQLAGVEGYLESTGSGLVAALDLWGKLTGRDVALPAETLLGALANYTLRPNPNFQPMNANFGLLPPIEAKLNKKERRKQYSERSLKSLLVWVKYFE
ncbi:MAG: methylenetetrahydrofolate--tRNA-(uracil(54)-C(5))-methyltransferase (FADH(2)-oxidizing) TrmFO [Bacillota bacterium]|jgi:methylenetetrahydrofolate--tRNA-(uracil-5-)-methyltransferase|nr:methylenetetrahydrofolate--tRNA-(uracil(54)-C(5))-methyltransferase (FADH(2)-oxidizing) TrmFO [Bacillota bacterium]HOC05841.1 methylenetetrahydrofolate--tRNA-(uracil(54)-C(5))-methyltransferase (FADH(2)-oxidizing) TrmFO [Bacillota bacterium]HPZ21709.1 methylenetetrahydrofolate--tRNA-(uracil(54)-C(5))-methyltransferase (FADH(2)-oxidizing) TrmFO [Bacillota bacterium]HQD19546.1 methylenetetrahydrofolate--tRNA-(uracil(54)-C(5))-methyltransferase (FADH(2)-oxidizing) TrmFO [Bacillota bacterium]